MNGVVYVAYGENARREVVRSIESLRLYNDLPVVVISDEPLDGVNTRIFKNSGPGARWAKLNADRLVEFEQVLYLDADTRGKGDISAGFGFLSDGWDLLITPSTDTSMQLIELTERTITLEEIGNLHPLYLQAGVFFFNRETCAELFAAWRDEWLRFKDKDQAALLRALNRTPVRVGLLGRDWNGGALIEHRFGKAV